MGSTQLELLGYDEPAFDAGFAHVRRYQLAHGAWVEYVPSWLEGHARVFDALVRTTQWRSGEQRMYDRTVETPRMFAALPEDGPGHPILERIRDALCARYDEAFERLSLALYRDGRDSVAWHGDRVARRMDAALVATVSVGAPRRFLLRERLGGEALRFNLGWGDLLVMGGSCQRTFRHSVPKLAYAEPRIAIMFRPSWYDLERAH
jgi:alkylated DNA repair dioxygenase AlkB